MKLGQRRAKAAQVIIGDAPSSSQARETQEVYAQNGGSVTGPNAGNGDTVSILQKHIADLTRQLQAINNQKEELEKDVESLCMQQGSSIFDSSLVLSERAFSAEKELRVKNAQLANLTEECNDLKEDLKGHRESRRSAENSYRAEKGRAEKLENDLKFYQEQSARSMSDRDQARWEVEELRRIKGKLEGQAAKAESEAETTQADLLDLRLQFDLAQSRTNELETKAKDAERVPGLVQEIKGNEAQLSAQEDSIKALQNDYQAARDRVSSLEQDSDILKARVSELEHEMEQHNSKAAAAANSASETIRTLQARVCELEEACSALEARVEEAEGGLAASQAEAETSATEAQERLELQQSELQEQQTALEAGFTSKVAELELMLENTRQQLNDVTQECEQATREKVETLLRVSQAEQTAEHAFEETGHLREQVNDLKDRESQARQEKVAALMQVASLQEHLRGGNAAVKSPLATKGLGWRLWGTTSPQDKVAEQKENNQHRAGQGEISPKAKEVEP